jgi:hypothetical protein
VVESVGCWRDKRGYAPQRRDNTPSGDGSLLVADVAGIGVFVHDSALKALEPARGCRDPEAGYRSLKP